MEYSGVLTTHFTDEELSRFYQDRTRWTGEINQYLVIEDSANNLIGPFRSNGEQWEDVPYRKFTSQHFGEIKPKDKDPYQIAYMDSLCRNQLTFCTGPAGSGKSQIALAYAFQELEKGRVDRIIIFTNPLISRGAVKLGFLPGTKEEKLLETSIGNILISKLGGRMEVEKLLEREELVVMPMGDCRGYEIPSNSFVYFTEAQNTSPYLMKLFLQRLTDNCIVCIEGDVRQTDSDLFEGEENGLVRAINVFKGEDYASHVALRTIYRGRIARKAEEICN